MLQSTPTLSRLHTAQSSNEMEIGSTAWSGESALYSWMATVEIPREWVRSMGLGVTVAMLGQGFSTGWNRSRLLLKKDFTRTSPRALDETGVGAALPGWLVGQCGGSTQGLAPMVGLLIGKVVDSQGECDPAALANGIYWAVECGSHLVVAPGLRELPESLNAAIRMAAERDIVIIVPFACNYAKKLPNVIVAPSVIKNWGQGPPVSRKAAVAAITAIATLAISKHHQHGGKTPLRNPEDLKAHLQGLGKPNTTTTQNHSYHVHLHVKPAKRYFAGASLSG
jgi:hypothetical protein